jgi:hypothetical protein
MHRFLMRNHAPVLSVSKELKTWVAVIGLTLLAAAAWADPQSEISAYRKTYGLPAVTADAKLTELARQQANAMAERRSMDHNVYATFHSRIAPYVPSRSLSVPRAIWQKGKRLRLRTAGLLRKP